MALRSYQLTLAAAAKQLSDVYIDGTPAGGSASNPNPKTDITYRQITLYAEGAAVAVGMNSSVVAAGPYGDLIASAGRVTYGPFDTGPLHLSDFWVAGAGATVHVTGIPF
jgi:hypothetical protein